MMRRAVIPRFVRPATPRVARTLAEIERDLDDEFDFHLAAASRALVDAGVAEPEAGRRARERFGDVDAIKSRCRRIALEEQIMMKRIHIGVTVTLGVAVVALFAILLTQVRASAQHMEIAHMEMARAQLEHQRSEQITEFLSTMLAVSDTGDGASITAEEMLRRAAAQAGQMDPDVSERVLAAVERARERLRQERAGE